MFNSLRNDSLPLAARGVGAGNRRPRTAFSPFFSASDHSLNSLPSAQPQASSIPLAPKPTPRSQSNPPTKSRTVTNYTSDTETSADDTFPISSDTISFYDGPNPLTIHVQDDSRSLSRDIICDKSKILSKMHYFRAYFSNDDPGDDVDVSVHCDLTVFEWLMKYIHEAPNTELSNSNVISVLISAEFLQINELVDDCLEYLIRNLNQVLRLPVDLSCLSDSLVSNLSRKISIEQLEFLSDRRGKLVPKIWLKKLTELLEAPSTNDSPSFSLAKCSVCLSVFAHSHYLNLACKSSEGVVDFRGKKLTRHEIDDSWDVNQWFLELKTKVKLDWRGIYWKVFGILTVLKCDTCNCYFSLSLLDHCLYHPENSLNGFYPCCGLPSSSLSEFSGCQGKRHSINQQLNSTIIELISTRSFLICEPFESKFERKNSTSSVAENFPLETTSDSSNSDFSVSSDSDSDCKTRVRRQKSRRKVRRDHKVQNRRLRMYKQDVLRERELTDMINLVKKVVSNRTKF
ncbi:hypothetical protein RCL1_005593 [Eukaryota sp. TZLM3-RCL]